MMWNGMKAADRPIGRPGPYALVRGAALFRRLSLPASMLFAMPLLAGTISLDISVTVNKRELEVDLEVLVGNSGSDTANRVQPTARIGDVTFEFESSAIGPGKQRLFYAQRKVLGIGAMKPGAYPVPVTVAYHDANGSSCYAPAYGLLRTADSAYVPTLTILADGVTLRDRDELTVKVQASGPQETQSVTITPHTTPAVTISPKTITVERVTAQPATVQFRLSNQAKLADFTMPLLLFVESETTDAHGTLVHEVPLTIIGAAASDQRDASPPRRLRWIIGLAGALVLLAAVSTVWIALRGKG
jgi:hypothetical protein